MKIIKSLKIFAFSLIIALAAVFAFAAPVRKVAAAETKPAAVATVEDGGAASEEDDGEWDTALLITGIVLGAAACAVSAVALIFAYRRKSE